MYYSISDLYYSSDMIATHSLTIKNAIIMKLSKRTVKESLQLFTKSLAHEQVKIFARKF